MASRCGKCGSERSGAVCDVCGEVYFGPVTLVAQASGKTRNFTLDTQIGRRLLSAIAPDDAAFASEPQFTLERDRTLGSWAVTHASGAANPTFVDGSDVGAAPRSIASGSVISVGPERLKLRVEIGE